MKRRVIALVAALLLAGVGTFVLVGFVQGAEDRATAGEERVEVFIIQRTVPRATTGEALATAVPPYVKLESLPIKAVAPGVVTNLDSLAGFVAEIDLTIGEQIIAGRWVAPGEVNTLRDALPERRVETPDGLLELPVSLGAEQALGGIIAAGDTVAVVASFESFPEDAAGETVTVGTDVVAIPGSTAEEASTIEATHIILHNALVVEVQATTPPSFVGEGDDGSTRLAPQGEFVVTFALSPRDVERVVFAAQYGELWLAAQTVDDVGPTSIVTIRDIFEG
jgi:pilus assembly protein CpaB